MQEQDWEARCAVCDDVIDTPLCTSCIEQEIEEWLTARSKTDLADFHTSIDSIALRDTDHSFPGCIKCGTAVQVCPYCFVRDMAEIIEIKRPELVDEFRAFFGFRKIG